MTSWPQDCLPGTGSYRDCSGGSLLTGVEGDLVVFPQVLIELGKVPVPVRGQWLVT